MNSSKVFSCNTYPRLTIRHLAIVFNIICAASALQIEAATSDVLKPLLISSPQPQVLLPVIADAQTIRSRPARVNQNLIGDKAEAVVANARFELNLFADTSYRAVVVRSETLGPGRWTAYGMLEGIPQSQFLLACNNGCLVGSIFVPGRGHFKIESHGGADCVVSELNSRLSGRCATCSGLSSDRVDMPTRRPSIGLLGIPPEVPPVTNIVSIVDIMVVYTPAALEGAGGTNSMNSLIDLAMAEANTIYQNSAANVRFRLVYRGLVVYAESPSLSTNLNRLRTVGDGYLDEVHGLRQTNGADLVCLITETADPGFAGLAFTPLKSPPLPDFAAKAFSVVKRSEAVATFTFAHEISHNLGCAHDREHALDATGTNLVYGSYNFSFGHRFTGGDGVEYRDLMSYAPGVQIPYLSNPNILFQGVPIGVPAGITSSSRCDG